MVRQALCHLLILFCRQVLLRAYHQHRLERIVQQIITDQLFKKALMDCIFQIIKGLLIL